LEKYTLVITEKPDAARRIAAALDTIGKPQKNIDNGVPYYSAHRNGNIIVVPALGHLYTVASKKRSSQDYPVLDYQWVPRYLTERGASRIRDWIKTISNLAENAEEFVDACDFDIEGSIIGYSILKYACRGKEQIAKRMKYSTLTEAELQVSYAHLLPRLDFALVEAGQARHEVDWLYGINLSRALTAAAKTSRGQYSLLSTGRVQGPTLKFVEEREKTIKGFVPTPYWNITAKISIDGAPYEAEYEKILQSMREADAVLNDSKAKEGKVETVKTEQFNLDPPVPFDLGALQSEAYRIFRYAPMLTSNIAQHLYLEALISYPRTSSQKLPATIGYERILQKLSKMPAYSKQAAELLSKEALKPTEGEKIDPAHPAIYPTGNPPEKPLRSSERNILDLIVRRFMAVFGEPAFRQRTSITLSINGNHFNLVGIRTSSDGWLRFYKPYLQLKEILLSSLTEGQQIVVKKVLLKSNFTKPPARYNLRSLLLKMEEVEIGTKATRAATIQTLYDRKYVQGTQPLVISDLGFEVTEILSKYSPTIVSKELTRKLEEEMNQIQQGKETKGNVLNKAIEILEPVLSELKQKEQEIGDQLKTPLKKVQLQEKMIGPCPHCVNGKLMILRSKKTRKRFVGCTNYFEARCNASFPLPQSGIVKPSKNVCKSCGWPTLRVWLKGRRPWTLCLDPSCPSKGARKA
jgi:DNA topoisomerase-1